MPAKVISIEIHPRFQRKEPEIYFLDEDTTIDEGLKGLKLDTILCRSDKE
jgi:hypothetical protein